MKESQALYEQAFYGPVFFNKLFFFFFSSFIFLFHSAFFETGGQLLTIFGLSERADTDTTRDMVAIGFIWQTTGKAHLFFVFVFMFALSTFVFFKTFTSTERARESESPLDDMTTNHYGTQGRIKRTTDILYLHFICIFLFFSPRF